VDKVNGRNHPLKSSDVSKILRYHLKEGNKGKVPTGYQKFIARCKKDAYLSDVMNCPDSDGDVSGSGKCRPKLGGGIKPINTICKARFGKFFPFKPKLWRIIH
jgi:hypothetical protein